MAAPEEVPMPSPLRRSFSFTVVVALIALTGCASRGGEGGPRRDAGPRPDAPPPAACTVGGPAVICMGDMELRCNPDGTEQGRRTCSTMGQVCAPDLGCSACYPGRGSCDGAMTLLCRPDGSGYDPGVLCDAAAGESCSPGLGTCVSLCSEAAASNSYIGCEYWPTPVMNSEIAPEFEFAVVIANPSPMAADVRIDRLGRSERMVTVPAGGLETVRLPWVNELKGETGAEASVLSLGGAYRLRSNVPVTVYQFNALDYRIPRDCAAEPGGLFPDGQCFSYSNDASLLLPTHVLTGNYLVISRPSMVDRITDPFFGDEQWLTSPGFFAVIGVEEVPVTVDITFRAHVQASVDGTIRAFAPGETGTFTLGQADVLQIASQYPQTCPAGSFMEDAGGTPITYCNMGRDYDLTGSEVRASGKVAVISGHNCDFVPYNRWACDHIEEAMFPLESWGADVIVSTTQPLRSEPNLIRVISSHDNNTVTFDPAVMAPALLNRGEFLEFESRDDVRVIGTEALLVTQFLVGQDYAGYGSSGMMGNGDPAMSLGIPTEQFRTQYTFLAPDTYETSFVNVTAAAGQEVILDGTAVGGWRPVGGTGMQTARVTISGGSHDINSASPFGIVVYGFGSYTSYMYPGGLDLEAINIPF